MNFLFLSFLAFTASALESPLTKFMGDPQLFVSAFENADKETIKKMISMVEDLLKEGEADRKAAIEAFEKAKSQNDGDKEVLAVATAEFNKASAALDKALGEQQHYEDLERTHYWALEAAKKALVLATNAHTDATNVHAATVHRVAEEKQSLEEAKTLLESTKSGGRRLLSETEADPNAVDKVIKEIDALIVAGEKEEADALSHLNAMTAAKESAEATEKAASEKYSNTVNGLNKAKAAVDSATKDHKAKKKVLKTARANEKKSAETLHSATVWKNIEVARVADEKKTLLEVDGLLKQML